ncbi:hypothetical protein [Paraburkholderia sacchari]|uniref:Uncharacterized protein n=1 Tax=Paraburkholderia sacchari TaxID=159450 RepID=A0A8T6ZJX3_9BURK|nr:hypothetical protein [Paraburkholderia sacchari]NLP65096.1 hypothetical protein [Paraburkholderia sacchari]
MIILGRDIQKFPDPNHPVFKDEPGNRDPQSVHFQADGGARRVQRVHAFYRALVETALYEAGVSRNV